MELDEQVQLGRSDFFRLKPETDEGIMVLNPPYGERMPLEDAPAFYGKIGDAFKSNWPGFSAWIISADVDGMKQVGLKIKRRIKCFNGAMECRWMGWDLYEGKGEEAPETETTA
jgi:putative N6-adenine-specific DNA methylase